MDVRAQGFTSTRAGFASGSRINAVSWWIVASTCICVFWIRKRNTKATLSVTFYREQTATEFYLCSNQRNVIFPFAIRIFTVTNAMIIHTTLNAINNHSMWTRRLWLPRFTGFDESRKALSIRFCSCSFSLMRNRYTVYMYATKCNALGMK